MISQMSTRIDPPTLVSYAVIIALGGDRASAWPVGHGVGTQPEHQPEVDAPAGRAAIHGRPLLVSQVLATHDEAETVGAEAAQIAM
jgi:hypothetical protein